MTIFDPFASIAVEFDQPVAPRLEFATLLAERLVAELRAPAPTDPHGGGWWARLQQSRPRARLVLVIVVLLLLVAGAASARYLGVRGWIATSPRGVQVAGTYRLATVYVDHGSEGPIAPWVVSRDGRSLVGLRYALRAERPAALVWIDHADSARRSTDVRPLSDFADPRLWSPAQFVGSLTVGALDDPWVPRSASAAFDADGDLFLLLEATTSLRPLGLPKRDASVIVARPDGTRQQVLSLRQLVRSGALSGDGQHGYAIASSAPDRLWLRVDSGDWQYPQPRSPRPLRHALFEVIDPNADGDWGDRVIRRVTFPIALGELWASGKAVHGLGVSAFVGDPADGGSVLDAISGPGNRLRVFRLADRNDDGDVSDPGELDVVLDRESALGSMTQVAPRTVSVGGRPSHEIVFAGLTRADRVSILSPSGRLTDVGRSFPGGVRGLSAGGDGNIYVATFNDLDAPRSITRVYRLEPVAATARTGATEATPRVSPPPSAGAVLAVTVVSRAGARASYWLPADGSVRRSLGNNLGSLCQSEDGKGVAFASDLVAPHEDFLYTAAASGGRGRRLTERQGSLQCAWSGRWFVLVSRGGYAADGLDTTVYRIDARGGDDVVLAAGIDRYSLSPDGRHLVFVRREETPSGWRETLRMVDVATLARRTLARSAPGRTYGEPLSYASVSPDGGFSWSPDGTRLAYVSSKTPWRPPWYGSVSEPNTGSRSGRRTSCPGLLDGCTRPGRCPGSPGRRTAPHSSSARWGAPDRPAAATVEQYREAGVAGRCFSSSTLTPVERGANRRRRPPVRGVGTVWPRACVRDESCVVVALGGGRRGEDRRRSDERVVGEGLDRLVT